MRKYLQTKELPQDDITARHIVLESDQFVMQDGILFHLFTGTKTRSSNLTRRQCAVPGSLRDLVLHMCHDDVTAGHLGFNKTYQKIRDRFWWPRL